MPQHSQANLSAVSINTNEYPISASAMAGRLLPAQGNDSAEKVALNIVGKKAGDATPEESRNFFARDDAFETEHLLKFMESLESLESCSTTLCDKLAQAEKKLAALKQHLASTLPGMASKACTAQSYGWERKLTRMQWRKI